MHRRRVAARGGAFYAADKQTKCAEKVTEHFDNWMHRFNSDG